VAIDTQQTPVDEASAYPAETIRALAELMDELERQRIRYCSWKSNEHLSEALVGRTDVDLLVDADHLERFRQILEDHRVKPLAPPPRQAFPGMEHYLGFDRASGRLFHLHVHDRLVLGDRYVKNHRIPMERAFLGSRRRLDGVPIPSPELELGVLSVRALLKYRARDVVKDVLKIRSPGIPDSIRDEIVWLSLRTSTNDVANAFRPGEIVPADLVHDFLDTYARDPRSGFVFLRLRTRLRSTLRELQRESRVRGGIRYIGTTWDRRTRLRRQPADVRMRPAAGGRAIAFVGADGSGKSTVTRELAEWLGWKLQVRTYYMGSKDPSAASRWSYLAFRALRRGHRDLGRRFGSSSVVATPVRGARDVMLALHHLSIGLDRMRRFRDARRDVDSGRVVLFDRFPLEMLSSNADHRLLDGPQIASSVPAFGFVTSRLARVEERMYRRFRLPHHLVVLEVSPDVSLARKPDHRSEVLVAKSAAASELATLAETARPPVDVIRVDADRGLDTVLLDVKTGVWDVL
jgi:gluconate kinase